MTELPASQANAVSTVPNEKTESAHSEKVIVRRETVYETPWFTLVAKTLAGETAPYYNIETLDYVTVLAITPGQELLMVRQYRPAREDYTLELPSGHVEHGETPEAAAHRELLEETGHDSTQMLALGPLVPDTGRLGNNLWCFLARDATPAPGPVERESGVELVVVPRASLATLMRSGMFGNAQNLAVLALAIAQGVYSL